MTPPKMLKEILENITMNEVDLTIRMKDKQLKRQLFQEIRFVK